MPQVSDASLLCTLFLANALVSLSKKVMAVLEVSASLVGKTLYALRRRATLSALIDTGQKQNLSVRDAWAATAEAIFASNPRAISFEVWEMQYPPPPRKPGGLFGSSNATTTTSSDGKNGNNGSNGTSNSSGSSASNTAQAAAAGASTAAETETALTRAKAAKEAAAATAAKGHGPTVTVLAKGTPNGPPLRTMTSNRKLNEVQ